MFEIFENPGTLLAKASLFFVDLWGVVHDGNTPFEGAKEFLRQAREEGKRIVLLSNSPRPAEGAVKRLNEMGITPDYYDAIITSGTHCVTDLNKGVYNHLGSKVYFYGPERERDFLSFLNPSFQEVASLKDADFIVMTSTLNWDDTLETVTPFLEEAHALSLSVVCANADYTVVRGTKEILCAGGIAQKYREMGGQAVVYGKPDANLYALAHQFFPDIPKSDIMMVGDSLRTDIQGAVNYGIRSALCVQHGVLREQLMPCLETRDWTSSQAVFERFGVGPTYIISELTGTKPCSNVASKLRAHL